METLNELGNAGIILLKKQDLCTSLFLKYLHVNYSHIGFYYKKNNPVVYKIIIMNVIELPHIQIKEWDLLEYLYKEEIFIQYKKFIKNGAGDHFNTCIKQLLDVELKISKSDTILNFFKRDFQTFELFNQTLIKIDPSIKTIGSLENTHEYLLDSKYFDTVKAVKVLKDLNFKGSKGPRGRTSINLISICKMFLETIEDVPELSGRIIEIVNNDAFGVQIFLEELASNYFNSSQQIFQDIIQGLKSKKIKSAEFVNHLRTMALDFDYLTKHQITAGVEGTKGSKGAEGPSGTFGDVETPHEDLIFTIDTKSRITATNNIKNILNTVSTEIKDGKVPIVQLNKLIDNFNILMKHVDDKYRPVNTLDDDISVYGMIIADKHLKDIPVQLKNGDKVMIPMSETNYSRFTKEQLEEMLVILDIYASGNNKFDQVRSNITKEIANKS